MPIDGKNGVVGSRVRVKSDSSRVVFRGREGHIDGFHRVGEEGDVATWRFSKTRNDVAVDFVWCCWAFPASELEVIPEPAPQPQPEPDPPGTIKLGGHSMHAWACDFVGRTAEKLFESSAYTKDYVRFYLDTRYLILRDGALVWNDKREEEDPRNRFSLTEDF
jgi:hypothetical protein